MSDPITGNVTLTTFPLTNSDSVRPTIKTVYGYAGCPDPNNQDGDNPYYVYSVKNERGFITVYLRDAKKRVTRINYPNGTYETFTYDDTRFGQVATHRLTSGGTIYYTYDTSGLLRNWYPSATPSDPDPSSHRTYYTYDANDQLLTIQDPRSKTTTLGHNARGQVTSVEHPDADHSKDLYDYKSDGALKTKTIPISSGATAVTSYTYDDYKRVKTVTSPGNGNSPCRRCNISMGQVTTGSMITRIPTPTSRAPCYPAVTSLRMSMTRTNASSPRPLVTRRAMPSHQQLRRKWQPRDDENPKRTRVDV